MGYSHIDELFKGTDHRIIKSHCSICHNEIKKPNKETKGNCCSTCNNRANLVSRGILTEEESDTYLKYLMTDLQNEEWIIDGVTYLKAPNGNLCEKEMN